MFRMLVIILLSISRCALAEIIFIDMPSDAIKYVTAPLDTTTWIMIDVDYTLTEPTDPIWQHVELRSRAGAYRDFLRSLTIEEQQALPIAIVTSCLNRLVDPLMPNLIEVWQQEAVVFAFTDSDTGSFGVIPNLVEWRESTLAELGIDFSSTQLSPSPLFFSMLPPFRGSYPLYRNGILYSNGLDKGIVLDFFIEQLGISPQRILFIDDSLQNLESVAEAAASKYIDFVGFKVRGGSLKESQLSDREWAKGMNQFRNALKETLNRM